MTAAIFTDATFVRQSIPITAIVIDPELQTRASGVDPAIVDEYAAILRSEAQLPPIDVVIEGPGRYLLADGFHRIPAHQAAGIWRVPALVWCSTELSARELATRLACRANAEHGLRRSAADKRRAIRLWLSDPDRARMSDRAIAEQCRVHHGLVGTVREELGATATERVGRDGRVQQVRQAAPEPQPEPPRAETPPPASGRQEPLLEVAPAPAPAPGGGSASAPAAATPAPAPISREDELAAIRRRLGELEPNREELREALAEVPVSDVRAATRPQRIALDAYYTPPALARACCAWLRASGYLPRRSGLDVLEAHVGGWAWVAALAPIATRPRWWVVDVDPAAAEGPSGPPFDEVLVEGRHCSDFLEYRGAHGVVRSDGGKHDGTFDVILGNPPYADLAEPHLRHALTLLRPGGVLAWILRRDWLGAARAPLVREGLAPAAEAVITPRQTFEGTEGTDRHEHSLFVWVGGERRRHWRTEVLEAPRVPRG